MKIKFVPLLIFLIVYIFLFAAMPQNIKLLLIYITPLILYTIYITKVMSVFMKNKKSFNDDTEVNETVSSVSYFEKKKPEEMCIRDSCHF